MVIAGSFLLAACGDDGTASPTATAAIPSSSVAVSMMDNVFVPNELVVPIGVPVTFIATNDGAAVHNMLVTVGDTQFRSDLMVAPGDSSEFQVTFPERGDYAFVCGLHLPDMAGTISAR